MKTGRRFFSVTRWRYQKLYERSTEQHNVNKAPRSTLTVAEVILMCKFKLR